MHEKAEKKGISMNSSEQQPVTINIVQGAQGAEFDRSDLQIVAGADTVWVN